MFYVYIIMLVISLIKLSKDEEKEKSSCTDFETT